MKSTGVRRSLKWSVERRLEFIEFRLLWENGINRADLIQKFEVSVPQASKDLAMYQELAPQNLKYDKRLKRYVSTANFLPMFLKADPNIYLSQLRSLSEETGRISDTWIGVAPPIDVVLSPRRQVDVETLKSILAAIRSNRSIGISYQSMSSDQADPTWLTITPHAFGYDSFRWHVRAYCHETGKFRDFLLPRILATGHMAAPGAYAAQDRLWVDTFDVVIGPHPHLSPNQQKAVAKDYGMVRGRGRLSIRYAMLFYVLKRLGLLADATQISSRTQHIVVLNREDTDAALKVAEFVL